MRYVGLLRGINVGGANLISMAELRSAFEDAGMGAVRTYINSGNVLFDTDIEDRDQLVGLLQQTILERTGVASDIQLRDENEIAAVIEAIPAEWTNDASMKCDVLFLQPDVDGAEILDELGPRPGIEDALYVRGAVVWRIDRENASRNRLTRIVGTPLYSRVTVRNCNTVRKLLELLRD
jgi:uncharacterized protein (DUF1697 family)